MGIPSYYKKLLETVPALIRKSHPGISSDGIAWLFMDFNCLIYHCLYREDTPSYYGNDRKDEWEAEFLECVVNYCLKVIKEVNPTEGVYIAIDGVVPMAKMRQQRLRRFKSSWESRVKTKSAAKSDADGEETKEKWDRNAITPGTRFMEKLAESLQEMIRKHGKKSWALSSSAEPGEGEHKIIAEWRRRGKSSRGGNYAVYGLDADLIVLSMLGQELCGLSNDIWLFREEVNAGKMSYTEDGEEIFEWFSVNSLRDWLCAPFLRDAVSRRNFLLSYCFSMSVLGNDFLPSSLGLKIRDDGHDELLEIVRGIVGRGETLIDSDTLEISLFGLSSLFRILQDTEEPRLEKYLNRKTYLAYQFARGGKDGDGTPLEMCVGENNWPLAKVEEEFLLKDRKLVSDWREKYLQVFFSEKLGKICKEYLYGIQWIWAYYNGDWDKICFNWFYPYSLPPLWSWLYTCMTDGDGLCEFPGSVHIRASDISPVEQLALVLPIESWSLLPAGLEKELPYLAPQYFPSQFGFESAGKRYFWECESLIPLPTVLELKQIISWRKGASEMSS
jgi:5'-3' exonuclease